MNKQPVFPLHLRIESEPEELLFNLEEVSTSLEWFDSEDDDKSIVVVDDTEQPVRLKIEALKVLICEVKE